MYMMTINIKKIAMATMVLPLAVLLSGCASMSQISAMMPKNPFGSKTKAVATAVPISSQTMLSAAKASATSASPAVMPSMMKGCPKLKVWPTGRQLTIYQKGAVGDNMAIRHRGEISKVARECSLGQGRITVKFGVSGRLLLGPKGRSGATKLPMLVYVTDPTGKKILTQKVKVAVNVPNGKPFAYFSAVNRVTFKVPKNIPAKKLRVYISFDSSVPGAG